MSRTITKTNQKQSIYKRPQWIKTYLTNIKSKISENNYDLLNRYNDDMIISSMSDVTRHKNLSHFGLLTLMLDNDWKESVENDYRSIVSKIMIKHGNNGKETGYSHALKISLRSIVRFLSTNSRKKPETGEVSTIKFLTLIKPKDTLTREDLPTDEEVKKLILACADSARDKAMLSVHAEAGTRIGELLGMSIKDVTIDKYGAIIKVDGKTGVRPIRIVNSVPHLTKWINNHPFKDDKDYSLWIYINAHDTFGTQINYAGFNVILKKRLRQAGITKRITSHMFRHKEITDLASTLTESESRMRHGWEKSSNMPSRYTHLNQEDLDDKMLKIKGVKKQDPQTKETPRNCVYCNVLHPIDSEYCEVCSRPLDVAVAIRMEKEQEESTKALIQETLRQENSRHSIDKRSQKLQEQIQIQSSEIEQLKQQVKKLSQS